MTTHPDIAPSNSIPPPPLAIGAKDAARLVGISPRSWARLVSMGKAPPGHKCGGRRLWKLSTIRQFVENDFNWGEGGCT